MYVEEWRGIRPAPAGAPGRTRGLTPLAVMGVVPTREGGGESAAGNGLSSPPHGGHSTCGLPPRRGGSGLFASIQDLFSTGGLSGGRDRQEKTPAPLGARGRWTPAPPTSLTLVACRTLPHSFEFWHRAPSATTVAATLSKPLSRECLFDPLSERLSTSPGSGMCVAREPHLPRSRLVVSAHGGPRGQGHPVHRSRKHTPVASRCQPSPGGGGHFSKNTTEEGCGNLLQSAVTNDSYTP